VCSCLHACIPSIVLPEDSKEPGEARLVTNTQLVLYEWSQALKYPY